MNDDPLYRECRTVADRAKRAARGLAVASGSARNEALLAIADALTDARSTVLAANAEDVAAAEAAGLPAATVDRLRLDEKRVAEMAAGVRAVAALPDPVGHVVRGELRPNGLDVRKVRVPLGVILFIYESRPNVTTDAAALCVKSGNAVILRGGKEAARSNAAVGALIGPALAAAGVPADAVQVLGTPDRAAVGHLLGMADRIDLAIPRGGEALIRRVAAEAKMPVLKHYQGVCHVYLDTSAGAGVAVPVVEDSKCGRPSACNAAETLLVHRAAARRLLPPVAARLVERGVTLKCCPRTLELLPPSDRVTPAAPDDFGREFLDYVMAVKVVDSLADAVDHIAAFGSGHTDAIVTNDLDAAQQFVRAVDSAVVLVNASTRFNDGGQLGLGAEIGISTDKVHARGPCGLEELCSTKYVVFGEGQVRG